jgi:hypothetical protein
MCYDGDEDDGDGHDGGDDGDGYDDDDGDNVSVCVYSG